MNTQKLSIVQLRKTTLSNKNYESGGTFEFNITPQRRRKARSSGAFAPLNFEKLPFAPLDLQ